MNAWASIGYNGLWSAIRTISRCLKALVKHYESKGELEKAAAARRRLKAEQPPHPPKDGGDKLLAPQPAAPARGS